MAVAIVDDAAVDGGETLTLTLSNPSGATLADAKATGTIMDGDLPPLTATFQDVPDEHDGAAAFAFEVLFSEAIPTSYTVLRDDGAFQVAGGNVVKARRVDGRDDLREIHIKPSGHAAVTIELPPTADCDAEGAVCMDDGRRLSAGDSATVAGPPGLSVADAEGAEADGAVDFTVTLSRAAPRAVTVDYATADGSAHAGQDYESAEGTLTIAAGETAGTVSVTLVDDDHDDDGERFRLVLSNPSGAWLEDGEAIGKIRNGDPLPQAWLVRFGRAAADHAVEAVGARLEGGRALPHATFAGRRLWGGGGAAGCGPGRAADVRHARGGAEGLDGREAVAPPGPAGAGSDDGSGVAGGGVGPTALGAAAGPDACAPGANRNPAASGFGMAGGGVGSGALPGMTRNAMGGMGGMGANGATGPVGGMRVRPAMGPMDGMHGPPTDGGHRRSTLALLAGSSFLASTDADADVDGPRLSAWGNAASSRFDGVADGVSVDGETSTFLVGADAAWDRWLAGIAVAHSVGGGGYRGGAAAGGALDATLTAVHPYVRHEATDRLSVWGMLGYGAGGLTLATEGSAWSTDTAMRMAAGGGRGVLLRGGGGLELAAKMDARITRAASDAVTGETGLLGAAAGAAHRLRLLLEGTRTFAFGGSRTLQPTLEVGVRRDGGDAETGAGVDLGGGLRYADAALGLAVEARGRYLLAHRDEGYREWGAGASVRLDPGEAGMGPWLSLAPSWGASATGGAERLWSLADAGGLDGGGRGVDPGVRLDAETGWGLDAFGGRGAMRPYAGLRMAGQGREWRAGVRWTRAPALDFGWAATLSESVTRPATLGVVFELALRY